MMRTLQKYLAAALLAGAASPALAFTYAEGDLLLVFRKSGFNDVEFNLGSVSNYLGKAAGTQVAVSNWDVGLVRSNYNNSLQGVSFALVAEASLDSQPLRLWTTCAALPPGYEPTDLTYSKWSSMRGLINNVGAQAAGNTFTNVSEVYAVSQDTVGSYTYVMSGAGLTDPTDMGGASPFTVEAMLPTSLMFYEMKTTNSATRPPAVAAGWFCMDPGGLLLFTAGPLPGLPQPLIVGASRSNGVSRISFTCTNCVNYRLRYAADLGSTFNPLFGSIAGDKTNALKVLTDSTSAARRFYVVEPYR